MKPCSKCGYKDNNPNFNYCVKCCNDLKKKEVKEAKDEIIKNRIIEEFKDMTLVEIKEYIECGGLEAPIISPKYLKEIREKNGSWIKQEESI